MTSVGLLFVGSVLFVNGIGLLGGISPAGSAPLNLFVGAMQVVFPTIAIVLADGNLSAIYGFAGIYLFGFTYLWVGLNNLTGADGRGFGWFALFVAVIAVVYACTSWSNDPVNTIIWLTWALMWGMFFVLLALGRSECTAFTGWLLVIGSHLTCTIPALVTLRGHWSTSRGWAAAALAIAVVTVALCGALARLAPTVPTTASAVDPAPTS